MNEEFLVQVPISACASLDSRSARFSLLSTSSDLSLDCCIIPFSQDAFFVFEMSELSFLNNLSVERLYAVMPAAPPPLSLFTANLYFPLPT